MTQLAIGKPTPLGAHYDGQGVNFTLFSAHAERVELCVFDANGQEHRYDLPGHSGDIWHGYLPDARRVCVMVIAFMAPGNLPRGIALTRRSC